MWFVLICNMKELVITEEAVEITFLRDIFDQDGNAINKKGETIRFLPLLLQSCMHPENFTMHPVYLKFEKKNGKETVVIESRYETAVYDCDDIELNRKEYNPAIRKAGCNPCRNCGRC